MAQFLLADLSTGQFNCGKFQQETESLRLIGHTQKVETLAFSSDGKTLLSTGADGTILLWDWNEVLTEFIQKRIMIK